MSNTNTNPFTSDFGQEPKELETRSYVLNDIIRGWHNGPGSEFASTALYGIHGSGKTTMLDCLDAIARHYGYIVCHVSANDMMTDEILNQIGIPSNEYMASRFTTQLEEACIRLHEQDCFGIILLIDDIDNKYQQQLIEVINAYVRNIQYCNMFLVIAGTIKQIWKLQDAPGMSFLSRISMEQLIFLTSDETKHVLTATCEGSGLSISEEAMDVIAEYSNGHPFAVQLFGSIAWDIARKNDRNVITRDDAEEAIKAGKPIFMKKIIRPSVQCLRKVEKNLLFDIASAGEYASSEYLREKKHSYVRSALLDEQLIELYQNSEESYRYRIAVPFLKEYVLEHEKRFKPTEK